MKARHLLKIVIAFFILSCSKHDPDPGITCQTYYLNSLPDPSGTVFVYYNSDGHVSEYVGKDTIVSFQYNDAGRIKSRKSYSSRTDYYYDGSNVLKYFLKYENGVPRDSVVCAFDQNNRLTSQTTYDFRGIQPTKRIDCSYSGMNSTETKIYTPDPNNPETLKLLVTFSYEFDNKKRPFPKEEWPFYSLLDNGAISENNVTKETTDDGQGPSAMTWSYRYNDGGYPTEVRINNVLIQQYTYSCEPTLRGSK